MDMETLWAYYRMAAALRGRQEEQDGRFTQSNFSLLWFYQRALDRLGPLARAFLGDAEAMEALPWDAVPPEGWEPFLLEGRPLNDGQREAVRLALAAPVTFIQGPPGTGKTETILNLACCAARLGGGRSVAIVSSNNSALANIRVKVDTARPDQPNRLWLRSHFAPLGDKRKRQEFRDLRPGEQVFRFHSCRVLVPTEEGLLSLNREEHIQAPDFLQKYPIITSTIHSLQNCFQDGPSYLYDYVIMDESSQTDPVAGLVAMSGAKHLVLVGDPKQLPPVIGDGFVAEMDRLAADQGWDISPAHRIAADRSFLDVCLEVFGPRTARALLRCHYRCHPGIINFCARTVYQEERLEICTPRWDRSVRTPIRVLWFEGDYCEPYFLQESGNRRRRSKHNRKQVLCFMEEEWPQLYERLWPPAGADQAPLSVCILSPFKGQLAALGKAIREDLAARGQDGGAVALEDPSTRPGDPQEPPMLTIHKSQGREFDIVYLLPVEDGDWEWPWSQQKRLINVAVSRAMKELRLVLSSALMEEAIQRELTGRPVPPKKGPALHGNAEDQRFLQKLVGYVREENQALERETGTAGYPESAYEYGFHRSARTSVFDRKPWLLAEAKRENGGGADMETMETTAAAGTTAAETTSPEHCVETALIQVVRTFWERRGIRLSLYRGVHLADIREPHGGIPLLPEEDRELRDLVDKGGHLDFVLCQGDRILLAIEVDGGYHRTSLTQQKRDRCKDRLLRDVLGAAYYPDNAAPEDLTAGTFAFLRLPDDGSTCLETLDLWEAGTPDQQARRFPLERLLELQLDRPEDAPSYCIPVRTITTLVKEWDQPEGSRPAQSAGQRLLDGELLVKCPCPELGHPEKLSVAPTGAGRDLGIVRGILVDRAGELYRNALYPKSAQRAVLRLLNGYPLLMAGMPVRELLEAVYEPFRAYLQGLESQEARLEALIRLNRAISFQSDGMDYQDVEAQEMYILRYLYGYAYEYKQMYLRMLDREACPGERLSVTSIGCGNMVDYWALRAALAERPGAVGGVDYTGVDINAWSKRFHLRAEDGDTVTFVQQDAAAYLQAQAAAGAPASDVYVFPKSIGEFDGRKTVDGPILRGIREGLQAVLAASAQERVWLLISLPKSEYYAQEDQAKCAFLREGLAQAGFSTGDPVGDFLTDGERQKIRQADKGFSYPRQYFEDMREYGEYEGRHDPVVNTGYSCYQALLFRRKE